MKNLDSMKHGKAAESMMERLSMTESMSAMAKESMLAGTPREESKKRRRLLIQSLFEE